MPKSFLLTNQRYRIGHYSYHRHRRKGYGVFEVTEPPVFQPELYDARLLLQESLRYLRQETAPALIAQRLAASHSAPENLHYLLHDRSQYRTAPRVRSYSVDSEESSLPETVTDESSNHVCSICLKSYSTSSNLARHRQTHRSLTDKKARKCPHCEKVYVSIPAFSMHVRTHNQGCECQYCGKKFSRPWLLQGHIRTHTGEKPFSCQKCGKSFADKSNLRAHVQTHSTEKPFLCGKCGKAFALKSYLYKHEEASCLRGEPRQQLAMVQEQLSED